MKFGARLIIFGSIFGSLVLGSVLYLFSGYLISGSLPGLTNSSPAAVSGDTGSGSGSAHGTAQTDQKGGLQVPCEISQKYPHKVLRWCDLISVYAHERDLPPDLVAALILQESGGNPKAYSGSGAVGLMQIMPRDGLAAAFICANGSCFHDRPPQAKLVDPEFNIKYGTKMLARLLRTHGDMREALKAYGPMDVGYYYADKVLALYSAHHK